MQVQSEWKWAQKVDRALFVSPLPWMMKCTYGEWTHQTRICLQIHRHNNPINCVKMCSVQDTKGNQISQRMHSLHPAEVEDVALAHLVHCLFNSFFQGLHLRENIIIRVNVNDSSASFQLNAPCPRCLHGFPFQRLLTLTFDGHPLTFHGGCSFQAT